MAVSSGNYFRSEIMRPFGLFYIFACYDHHNSSVLYTMSKSENTKQFIIEKTAPVFNTKGYAGTSMNDIMRATGLSKGCIYGNFENKDDVALAAFDFNHRKVREHLKARILATEHSIERLLVYPHSYKNYYRFSCSL